MMAFEEPLDFSAERGTQVTHCVPYAVLQPLQHRNYSDTTHSNFSWRVTKYSAHLSLTFQKLDKQ